VANLPLILGLSLGANQLTELPAEIGNLTSLKSLSLYRNQLTELPPEIGDLGGLERLWVGNNRLTAISQNMVKLEKLNQGRSSIKVFGEFVSSGRIVCRPGRPLRRTPKGLDLSHNLLTILPPEINQLREEWGIDLSGNPLMS
jgi:Leucine-rich repeat (LRR) protein